MANQGQSVKVKLKIKKKKERINKFLSLIKAVGSRKLASNGPTWKKWDLLEVDPTEEAKAH